MVSMAWNWLASAELPASFWFFAVRRAAEICNCFPYTLEDGRITTPFVLVHHCKPDLKFYLNYSVLLLLRGKGLGTIQFPNLTQRAFRS
jgi:hypothetical protein